MLKLFARFARRLARLGGQGVVAYVSPTPPPSYTAEYDFSDKRNSQYIFTLPIF